MPMLNQCVSGDRFPNNPISSVLLAMTSILCSFNCCLTPLAYINESEIDDA